LLSLQALKTLPLTSISSELKKGDGLKTVQQDIYLNADRAREKFMAMASRRLGVDRAKEIIDLVFRMEELGSIVPIVERMKMVT
jgi:hypothetical protein